MSLWVRLVEGEGGEDEGGVDEEDEDVAGSGRLVGGGGGCDEVDVHKQRSHRTMKTLASCRRPTSMSWAKMVVARQMAKSQR